MVRRREAEADQCAEWRHHVQRDEKREGAISADLG